MNVDLRPEASGDLVSTAAYFNNKRDGWGDHFLDSLEADLVDLGREAGIHKLRFGLQCKLAKVFPFAIYYRIESSAAVVYAILSCRMNPNTHRSILSERG